MYKGKLNIVQNEMNRMDIDILGISEMKWIGRGHFRSANNTVLYSGHNTHKKNGVGLLITNQMSQSLIGYKAVNDIIIYIQGVTGGTDPTSGECSLGQTIPI